MANFQNLIAELIQHGAIDLEHMRDGCLNLWETSLIHSALCSQNEDFWKWDNSEFHKKFNKELAKFNS
jgi:hypothetical protein